MSLGRTGRKDHSFSVGSTDEITCLGRDGIDSVDYRS